MKLFIKYVIVSGIVFSSFIIFSNLTADHAVKLPVIESDTTLSIIFAGDIMQHKMQIDAAWDDSLQAYSYDSCFKYVAPLIRENDLAIANFEFTLGGPPYSGYPQFSAPDQTVNALLYAGFDIVGTANNHSCDRGSKGIERTIHILDSMGLKHMGTYKDSASRATSFPMIIHKKGFKLALLNYTYGTNGIPARYPNIVNLIDEAQIKSDLKQAKDSLPDKIIVFIHWGDEYKSYPNQYQEYYEKLCLDHGADIIIGMHPHVIQKIERMYYPDSNGREVFVAWSLGNYVSNQRDRYRDGGLMVKIDLIKKHNKVRIADCGYYLSWVYTPDENGKRKFYIVPADKFSKFPGFLDSASYNKMQLYISDSRMLMQQESKGISEFRYDVKTDFWKKE